MQTLKKNYYYFFLLFTLREQVIIFATQNKTKREHKEIIKINKSETKKKKFCVPS